MASSTSSTRPATSTLGLMPIVVHVSSSSCAVSRGSAWSSRSRPSTPSPTRRQRWAPRPFTFLVACTRWGAAGCPARAESAHHVVQQVEDDRENHEQDDGEQLFAEGGVDDRSSPDEILAQHLDCLKRGASAEDDCGEDCGLQCVEHERVDVELTDI